MFSIRLLLVSAAAAYAQDPTMFDGPVAPMRNQLHFTSEVTGGLDEQFALGFMLLAFGSLAAATTISGRWR